MPDYKHPVYAFKNPYLPVVGTDKEKRVNTDIDIADWILIRSCGILPGSPTTTFNLLIKKFCDELRIRGITDSTKHVEFERFASECRIVDGAEYEQLLLDAAKQSIVGLHDSAASRPAGKRKRGGIQRGGTESDGDTAPNEPKKPSDIQGDS